MKHNRKNKVKGSPASTKEYWKSRLHHHGESLGRSTKTLTHRKERRDGKSELRRDEDD
jgi:hypothetical protein